MTKRSKLSVVRRVAVAMAFAGAGAQCNADTGGMASSKASPPGSMIQVAVKGTVEELKDVCEFVEPRLKVKYLHGCKKLQEKEKVDSVVFIFSRDDILSQATVLELFAQAFVDQVRKYPVPPKNHSVQLSYKPCLKKVSCEGADRWWPCECL